jgi:hypothetical protein
MDATGEEAEGLVAAVPGDVDSPIRSTLRMSSRRLLLG